MYLHVTFLRLHVQEWIGRFLVCVVCGAPHPVRYVHSTGKQIPHFISERKKSSNKSLTLVLDTDKGFFNVVQNTMCCSSSVHALQCCPVLCKSLVTTNLLVFPFSFFLYINIYMRRNQPDHCTNTLLSAGCSKYSELERKPASAGLELITTPLFGDCWGIALCKRTNHLQSHWATHWRMWHAGDPNK